MSTTVEEIADQLAVRALTDRYAIACDARDREGFAGLFTPEGSLAVYETDDTPAVVEYTGHEALRSVMDLLRGFTTTFHLMGNRVAEIDGDSGTGDVYCIAHHIIEGEGGGETDLAMYIRYRDVYVRTPEGWRFARRDVMRQWTEERPAARRPLDL